MKKLMYMVRTTIVGGALFLTPFVIILFVLGKAHKVIQTMVTPIAERLPFESVIGLETPRGLAGLLLVLICFVAGLFARTSRAKKLVNWLETAILSNLPGYSFMRSVGEEFAGNDPTDSHQSVLVCLDDAYQLGVLVERLSSGHVVVFLPGAPKPWDGDVMIVEESRVKLLSPSSKLAVSCLQQLGGGVGGLVEGKLGENSVPDSGQRVHMSTDTEAMDDA